VMRRREFLGAFAIALASLGKARAQAAARRVGVLMGIEQPDPDASPRAAAFRERLRTLGWIDGQNVRIEYRWLTPDASRLLQDAAAIVETKPAVLVADSTAVLSALRPLS